MDEPDERVWRSDEQELLVVWHAPAERRMYEQARQRAAQTGNREAERLLRERLNELPQVDSLQALAANRRLVEMLTGQRWFEMQAAREAGAEWSQIGAALGISKQAAWEWYRRKIGEQEKHAAEFHEAARARAALGDTPA